MAAYHHFYKSIDSQARQLFPSLKDTPEVAWDFLISPLELKLGRSIFDKAQKAIAALHSVSRRDEYRSKLAPIPGISQVSAPNQSVLMAYDFHTNEQGDCFLVEINTNASGFLLACLMESVHSGTPVNQLEAMISLRKSFEQEAALSHRQLAGTRVAITDDDIQGQKMLPEFLMYRDWFKALGADANFVEARDFQFKDNQLLGPSGPIDFVYNRCTDFYFEDPAHLALLQAFQAQAACITPQPIEYWLLADKQRLAQWTEKDFLDFVSEDERSAITKVLIPTFEKTAYASEEEIWAQRKTLFFKPKRSFGGKSVYRGESVSRKVFERLMSEDILIQHFQPAAKFPTDDPRSVLTNWKYDLRFFVYGGEVQLAAARAYQGQVTNFSSVMGGFTRIQFV